MGTVKYTGPVASFHCPTNAEIRSLKVHFSPKQLGEGTPSPDNVREIEGWDGVEVEQRGKNLFDADNVVHTSTNCWVSSNSEHKITNSNVDRTVYIPCLPNTTYTISKSVGNVLGVGYTTVLPEANVPTFSYYRDNSARVATVTTGADAKYLAIWYYDGSKTFDKTVTPEYIYRTLQVELDSTATSYEPYHGSTTNYTFGVLGKNKLNADAEQQAPDNTNMMPTNKRIFTPNTYCVGMSWSNYYVPNNVTSYSVSNGTITVTNGNVYGLGYPVRVAPGQAYHLSATTTNGRAHIAYFAADGTYISGVSTNILNSSFTVPNDVKTAVIIFYSNSGEATFSNIQLELGSTATTYEPYNPKDTVYGGWVDLISGEVCEEWSNPIIYDGIINKGISAIKNADMDRFGVSLGYVVPNSNPEQKQWSRNWAVICDKMPIKSNVAPSEPPYIYPSPTGNLYNHFYLDKISDHQELSTNEEILDYVNQWLEENPITIVYFLSASNTYHLAPTQLQTFLGRNNVWSNTDYVEVEYDLHETQDILARKQFIIANQPHTVKASGSLVNFETDMAAALKECKVGFKPIQDTSNGAPSPDNICPISGWENIITSINRAPLPEEYQEVEYIQSTSIYSYFITDYYPSDRTDYYIKIHQGNAATDDFYPTAFSAGPQFELYKTGYYVWNNYKGTSYVSPAAYGSNRGLLEMSTHGNEWTIIAPGVRTSVYSIPSYDPFISEKSLIILAREVNGEIRDNRIGDPYPKLYRFTLYENEETVRDYVPCYRKSDNEVGLYDLVNKTFLTHSGEGTFNAGPDITIGSVVYSEWANDAGTIYGGYVDLVTGEVWKTYHHMTIDKNSKVGIFPWMGIRTDSDTGLEYTAVLWTREKTDPKAKGYANLICYCDSYPYHTLGSSTRIMNTAGMYDGDTYGPSLFLPISEVGTTSESLAAFMEDKTFNFVYLMSTPQLAGTLSPSQLKSLRGINNVWSNTNDNITVKYWKH